MKPPASPITFILSWGLSLTASFAWARAAECGWEKALWLGLGSATSMVIVQRAIVFFWRVS